MSFFLGGEPLYGWIYLRCDFHSLNYGVKMYKQILTRSSSSGIPIWQMFLVIININKINQNDIKQGIEKATFRASRFKIQRCEERKKERKKEKVDI